MRSAATTLQAAGYEPIGLDHFAAPDDPLAAAQRGGRLHRNFQGYTTDEATALIGFGTSSISRLPEGYAQNLSRTLDYGGSIDADRPATARGIVLTPDDRVRGAIIERLMCDLAVDLETIAAEHAVDPFFFRHQLAAIDALAEDGLVERDGLRLTVPDAARPFVRNVCAVFDSYLAGETGRYSRAV
jgi:oxygen-independent coproporphyrinogen-3 oxidase